MQSHKDLNIPAPSFSLDESQPAFRLFVTYDSESSNAEALETCNYVEEQFRGDCNVQRVVWNSQLFDAPRLREIAAQEAANADMIIIASDRRNETQTSLLKWIRSWRDKRNASGALVALVKSDASGNEPFIFEYLQRVAKSTNMDFIGKRTSNSL